MNDMPIILQSLPTSKQMMRIAVVTETYPPEINGVAMTIGRMVSALQERDHQIQLIRPRQSEIDTPLQEKHIEEVLQRGMSIPRYDGLKMGLPAKSALLRLWTIKRPDIVHIATEGPLGWSALSAANKLKIPTSTDFHTNFHVYSKHYGFGWLRKPIIAYLRKLHNKALCTMVPTEGIRKELFESGYENLIVVRRGVDTQLFNPAKRSQALRTQWGAGEKDLVVLYVGRLAPEKNLPVVLSAFNKMRQKRPEAKLVLVGDGPERGELEHLNPGHIFAGMRTGEDLAAHYASADAFLFPSITETYGNVTMEAMASGLAVVAYDYAAAAEHIRNGQNGLVAMFDNERQFIEQAAALAADDVALAELGKNARITAENIDWKDIHDQFEQVLLKIVKRGESNDSEISLETSQPLG
ncbi:glycosyltransferase family 4 protein [Sulfurirhabdus autotrophica]|nr:glycosyltransferase family 1 protein [Sulfurirhabdus autotrophica]